MRKGLRCQCPAQGDGWQPYTLQARVAGFARLTGQEGIASEIKFYRAKLLIIVWGFSHIWYKQNVNVQY